MKKILLTVLATLSLYAEASFDQVQNLIDKQEYKQAKLALTIITQNHPDSSKAFYSLAQANAGLGDLVSARSALEKAQALNPTLNFVPASQVENLKQAITPQAKLITKVEEPSHWFRNTILLAILAGLAFFGYRKFKPTPKPAEPEQPTTKYTAPEPTPQTPKSEPVKPREETIEEKNYRVYGVEPKRSYEESNPKVYPTSREQLYNPVREVHHYHDTHHHHNDNNTLSTVVTAGVTAAAVSSLMNHHDTHSGSSHTTVINNNYAQSVDSWENTRVVDKPHPSWNEPTHSYEPEKISNSWADDTSTSSSWEDKSTKSNSWSDNSSSSDSWSSNSDSGSSDSWGD